MRCVFAGTPAVAAEALSALLASTHEVVAVVTRPDAPAGRGRKQARSPVAELADASGVEVLQPTSARDSELGDRLRDLAPDCAPVVAYGSLIPASVLAIPRLGWVNVHYSLLPAWRGAAPVQHAIWHGDDITGVTTFRLDEGMDTGPVFGTATRAIGPRETAGDLLAALAPIGARLLVATLDALEAGALEAVPQTGSPSLAPKVDVDDARVTWTAPAIGVDRQVRACSPDPGAWSLIDGVRLRIGPVDVATGEESIAPGRIVVRRKEVLVGTATNPVRLGSVQAAGARAMAATDWARGARTSGDAAFE